MFVRSIAAAIAAVVLCAAAPASAQLRIVTYNVNASDPASPGPRTGMDAVLRAINGSAKGGFTRSIDILLLEEGASVTTTGSAYAGLLNSVTSGTSYRRSTVNGDTAGSGRPMAVYNSASVELIAEKRIGSISGTASQPRQTLRYQFRPVGYDAAADFYVYASHFKASSGAANEADRDTEARAIRADADALGQGASIIYAGDFNFYTSSEDGFQTLTGTGNGQAFDPISRVGSWSGNSTYKSVHTQSPATTLAFDGQVLGGVDDRFDFQLVTGEVKDGGGFDYIANSYWSFGNTGTHLINQAITTGSAATLAALLPGYTTAQAQAVLTNLSRVTDHLPVVADYQLPAKMAASLASVPARVIRGAGVTAALAVSNVAPVAVAAGADTLDYAYSSTGALAGSGTGSDAALGSGGTHLLTLSTTAAGLRSGTVSVVATSPQTASPTFSGTVSMNVLDHAIGSFSGTGTLKSLAIDFGTLIRGGDSGAAGFSIFNRPGSLGTGWTAKLDLDGVSTTAPMAIFSTSLVPFLGLSSGSSRAFGVSMAATTAGTFSGTYSLALSDEDLPGAISQSLSLSVRGSVIAASAGDTNYDGLIDIMDTANLVTSGRYGTGILADWEQGDFNADRLVDILDVADFLSTGLYNQGDYRNDVLANVAVVPEPTTQLAIWLVGGAMLMMIRRGRSRAASRATTGP
jgi:endonuclease/exonuclease/phosphatase family metal-dependent hydrolase